ncbi:Dynamin-1-like protein, partial [Orchesella cincta]
AVFRRLAQDQIQYIKGPALNCADRVNEEIIKIAERNLADRSDNAFKYFPELRKVLKSVITNMLDENLDSVKRQLEKQLYVGDDYSDEEPIAGSCNGTNNGSPFNEVELLPSVPTSSVAADGDKLLNKLKDPACISLIKKMVKLYFRLIKSHIQDFVPKLVADRLIIPFSDDDGSLGVELRVRVMENYETLTQLPLSVQRGHEKDKLLKEHLKEVIAELKEKLDDFNYEEFDQYDDDSDSGIRENGDAGSLDG